MGNAIAAACLAVAFACSAAHAADAPKDHHVAFQVDQSNADLMQEVLNNIDNMYSYYKDRGEPVEIELVAFGPGLTMLREDTSPLKSRLATEHEAHPGLVLSGCENSRRAMSRAEGHEVTLVAQSRPVPSGVVRLSELQEQGWTYLRP